MFEGLAKHKRIFVTGPHRSGTTICAKMIAHDTGHDLVIEEDFNCSNINQLAAMIHSDYGPQVIQCPFLAHIVHDFGYLFGIDMDECLVVFMRRDRDDIIDSERRAKFKNGKRVAFPRIGRSQHLSYHSDQDCHISELKYEAWEDQKEVLPHALDVEYESLRGHPLWVEKRNFHLRQTA